MTHSVEEERWNVWQLPNRNLQINKRNLVFFRWFWLGEKWKRWLTRFVKKMRKINFFLIIEKKNRKCCLYKLNHNSQAWSHKDKKYFFWNKILRCYFLDFSSKIYQCSYLTKKYTSILREKMHITKF